MVSCVGCGVGQGPSSTNFVINRAGVIDPRPALPTVPLVGRIPSAAQIVGRGLGEPLGAAASLWLVGLTAVGLIGGVWWLGRELGR